MSGFADPRWSNDWLAAGEGRHYLRAREGEGGMDRK